MSGYAVVADAASGEAKACSEWKDARKKNSLDGCRKMIWFADGIVRDALADVRFHIAKTM